jgi:two-component system, chemotaxis family, protein-glutamate methylesterase/glutaminase
MHRSPTNPTSDKQTDSRLRVMVVDDTKLFRHIMVNVLQTVQGVDVVSIAQNGREALELMRQTPVDVVFLDVEMPEMNGLGVLQSMRDMAEAPIAIMVSGHSKNHMHDTIQALNTGAYDFITKPNGANGTESETILQQAVLRLLKAIHYERSEERLRERKLLRQSQASAAVAAEPAADMTGDTDYSDSGTKETGSTTGTRSNIHQRIAQPQHQLQSAIHAPDKRARRIQDGPATTGISSHERLIMLDDGQEPAGKGSMRHAIDAVLIGISTGGPAALNKLIPKLNPALRVPVIIVQHMPEGFTATLAETLNHLTEMDVSEARDGELAKPAHIYIAPGGRHLEVVKGDDKLLRLKLTDAPPVNACRPSVDVLFESAANCFRKGALAVIMTGLGRDGSLGVEALKKSTHTWCITQEASSCTVYGMPKAVNERGLSDEQVALNELAKRINHFVS